MPHYHACNLQLSGPETKTCQLDKCSYLWGCFLPQCLYYSAIFLCASRLRLKRGWNRLKLLISTVRLKSTAHGCCAVENISTALQPLQPHFNRARKFLTFSSAALVRQIQLYNLTLSHCNSVTHRARSTTRSIGPILLVVLSGP